MNSSKESHRKAISVGLLGHVASNMTPIACLTLDGDLVKTYPSMKNAELEGYSHSAIYAVANNKRKSHGGYKWMYLSDYESLVNQ